MWIIEFLGNISLNVIEVLPYRKKIHSTKNTHKKYWEKNWTEFGLNRKIIYENYKL
jgi:hypothetical protein